MGHSDGVLWRLYSSLREMRQRCTRWYIGVHGIPCSARICSEGQTIYVKIAFLWYKRPSTKADTTTSSPLKRAKHLPSSTY